MHTLVAPLSWLLRFSWRPPEQVVVVMVVMVMIVILVVLVVKLVVLLLEMVIAVVLVDVLALFMVLQCSRYWF
jgi:hypothetical protein